MRRLAALLAALPVALLLPSAPHASAQDEEEGVRLILQSQTTTASRDEPFRVRVRAVNETDRTFRDLRIGIEIYAPTLSRSAYDEALVADLPFTLAQKDFVLPGSLRPGEDVVVPLEWKLQQLADEGQSRLYPLRIQLVSAFQPLAELRSAVVFLVDRPLIGLNVSLTFVLDVPLVLGPRGVFANDTLERALAPDGHLRAIVETLRAVGAGLPVTLVISPVLLQQLQAMTSRYQVVDPAGGLRTVEEGDPGPKRARRMLEAIAEVARRPETQVVALPFASPSLAALSDAGLTEDLDLQLERGRAVIEERLGVEPSETVVWPPASAITEDALEGLARAGIEKLILDAETLPPPPTKFTPAPTAALETGLGGSLRVLRPDTLVDARLHALPDHPTLRAQWVLGELAQIYFEFPGRDRGVALVFDEEDRPEHSFLRRLVLGISSTTQSPWVRGVTASRLLDPTPEPQPQELPQTRPIGRFPEDFLVEVAEAKDAVAQLASLGAEPETADRLNELVLLAESRYLLNDDERRRSYLERVHEVVSAEFAKIQVPEAGSVTTLTALGGTIPMTIHNRTGREVEVQVRLESSRPLEFIGGNTRTVTLSLPAQRFEFPVRAETTGRFPVSIVVTTPLGAEVASTDIVVRSTAYNRVALVVTIGAAVFLLVLWGRRFLPRRS